MKLTAHLDVPWPDEAERAQWWSDGASALEQTEIRDDGHLHSEGEVTPLRLIHGQHGEPGAVYLLNTPNLTRGESAAQITGEPGARSGRFDYLEAADPQRRAWIAVDTIERLSTITSQSTLEHLAWDLTLDVDAATPMIASLTLDWVSVEVTGTHATDPPAAAHAPTQATADDAGDPTTSEPGMDLEIDLRLHGIWRVILGPLLWIARPFLRRALERGTTSMVLEWRASAPDTNEDDAPELDVQTHEIEIGVGTDRVEVTDADLDLSWLASPISMISKVRAVAKADRASQGPPSI